MSRPREITISNPPKRSPDKAERLRNRKAEKFATRIEEGFKLLSTHR